MINLNYTNIINKSNQLISDLENKYIKIKKDENENWIIFIIPGELINNCKNSDELLYHIHEKFDLNN